VYQFKNNSYERPFYDFEKFESQTDFRASFLVDELNKKRKYIADNLDEKSDSIKAILTKDLNIIQTTLQNDYYKRGFEKELSMQWTLATFTPEFDKKLEDFLAAYKKFYLEGYNRAVAAREKVIFNLESDKRQDYKLNDYKNRYFNESLADLVQNISEKNRILEYKGQLFQQINPIFLSPNPKGPLDYRAHFFAPEKNLFGQTISTYTFNMMVIWLMTIVLYITLYFELMRKLINSFDKVPGKVNLPKVGLPKKK
jgi:hypothetical protein